MGLLGYPWFLGRIPVVRRWVLQDRGHNKELFLNRTRLEKIVTGGEPHPDGIKMEPPEDAGLLDNCLIVLPYRACLHCGLAPNMEDKKAMKKLWFGRVWQFRALMTERYALNRQRSRRQRGQDGGEGWHWMERAQVVAEWSGATPEMLAKVVKCQAHWRRALQQKRSTLHFLDMFKDINLRGFVVYMHGSGGMTGNNLRYARMVAGDGFLVIAPDNMAGGLYRSRETADLLTPNSNSDYWAKNLVYTSDVKGKLAYTTKVASVLDQPESFKTLYENVFRMRKAELDFILTRLPPFIKRKGVFLMGTSEGGMTIARYDDSRFGEMINGRIVSAYNVEYCYFTPTRAAALFAGSPFVPTLNIIGTHDQYFGSQNSVAQLVAKDEKSGYGDENLTGNAYKTMVDQRFDSGLVVLLDQALHDPTPTHDNVIRVLLESFMAKPSRCHKLVEQWAPDPYLSSLVELREREGNISQVFVKKPVAPQTMTMAEAELFMFSKGHFQRLREETEKQEGLLKTQIAEVHEMLRAAGDSLVGCQAPATPPPWCTPPRSPRDSLDLYSLEVLDVLDIISRYRSNSPERHTKLENIPEEEEAQCKSLRTDTGYAS